jgi:hypothetical protein
MVAQSAKYCLKRSNLRVIVALSILQQPFQKGAAIIEIALFWKGTTKESWRANIF